MLSFATVSVLSFLCCFTATGLACEGIMSRANNGHPNSISGRKAQQKMVKDGRAAADNESTEHKPKINLLVIVTE